MAVTYAIDHGRERITVRASGMVTFSELTEYAKARVVEGAASYDQIVDARGARFELSGAELELLVSVSQRAHAGAPFGRTAVVADHDDAFGIARLAELLSARAGILTRAFRSIDEAEAWLSTNPA